MNYSNELIVDTLDYSEVEDEQDESILQFRVRMIGKGVEATSGLNLTKIDRLLADWDSRDLTWENVMEVGHLIGNALFQEPLRQVLLQNLPKTGSEDGLRIRLLLKYPLTNYPFEYLLINDTGGETTANHFLGLRPNVSIVRHQDNQTPPSSQPPAAFPVKMVAALASPAGFQPILDLSKERTAIENAVNQYPARVQTVFCEPATLTNLEEAMQEVPIFHYAGHATMAKKASKIFGLLEGKGKLILDDDDGDGLPDPMTIEQLSLLLKAGKTRLAVLGGCETARRDDINVWSSLAAHLLNAGVFAVIGMQYKISNPSATLFAEEFYNALLAGLPIDQAVTLGRMAIAASDNVRDWGVPVGYLSGTTDGIVFKEFQDNPALEPARQEIFAKVDQVAKEVNGKLTGVKAMDISWGKVEVYHNIDIVGKDAEVVGLDAKRVGPGSNLNVTGKYGQVDGNVTGMVLGTVGSSKADIEMNVEQIKNSSQVTGQNIGDTYKTGDGTAIGQGASATVNKGVGDQAQIGTLVIYQGTPQATRSAVTGKRKLIEEKIRLDAALPSVVQLGEPFDLAVAVRQPHSSPLAIEDLAKVVSEDGNIFRAKADEVVKYRVEVTGTGCLVEPLHYVFRLRAGENSNPFYFQVTPQRPGKRSLLIAAYQEDDTLAAQTRVALEIQVPVIQDEIMEGGGSSRTDILTCQNCGTANRPGDKFCKECGNRLPVT
jgi:hypothetical protein